MRLRHRRRPLRARACGRGGATASTCFLVASHNFAAAVFVWRQTMRGGCVACLHLFALSSKQRDGLALEAVVFPPPRPCLNRPAMRVHRRRPPFCSPRPRRRRSRQGAFRRLKPSGRGCRAGANRVGPDRSPGVTSSPSRRRRNGAKCRCQSPGSTRRLPPSALRSLLRDAHNHRCHADDRRPSP